MAPDDDLTFTIDLDENDPGVQHYIAEQGGGEHGHQHVHQAPAAPDGPDVVTIVAESLAQGLPCPTCGSTAPCRCVPPDGYSATRTRAEFIVMALRSFGHLAPEAEPRGFDPVEAAQVLADRSAFARYEGIGFVKVMQSDPDVDLAAHYAMKRIPTAEVEMIRAARSGLLDWRKRTPADEIERTIRDAVNGV